MTVMTPGLAGPLRRSVGLDVEGGRVWSSAVGEGFRSTLCESVHNLRTITSIGAAVKAPPCVHRALAGRDRHRQRQAGQVPSVLMCRRSRAWGWPWVSSRSSVAAYQQHRLEEPPPMERLLLSHS